MKPLISFSLALMAYIPAARAETVAANFTSAATVPVTAASYTATGNAVKISLGFAPPTGTTFTVLENTGLGFIRGQFSNLGQGQQVKLSFNGVSYPFVANYYGGTGNDLVLQWANQNVCSWGANDHGQLGNNSMARSRVPVTVSQAGILFDKTVVAVSAGQYHSLALCSDGTVAAWGYNEFGQLGNNSTNDSSVPVAVSQAGILFDKTVVAVSAGQYHSLALCSDGTVAAWGYNEFGQLGNNSTNDSSVPVAVSQAGILFDKTVVAVSAAGGSLYGGSGGGGGSSLALCSDGTLVAWGNNSQGQLGNNSLVNSSVPVAVTTAGTPLASKIVTTISAKHKFCLVSCSDGTLATWGYNAYGQLGNSSTTNSSVPVAVTMNGTALANKMVATVAAGGSHGMALCSDGTLASWGYNSDGQLGNGNTTSSNIPVAVTTTGILSGKIVVSIAPGVYSHNIALCSDGTLAAWGYNAYGQLGNNSTASSNVPVEVMTDGILAGQKVTAIAAGYFHSLAIAAAPLSNNSSLSSLALSEGSLSPAFAAVTTAYAASVSNATTSVTITPSVAEANATVKVNGTLVTTGTASASIPLVVGNNPIIVQVTAQDGITTSTYTVTVTRVSTVSTLSGLALSTGSLSPAFTTGITAYTASVTASTIAVTPTVTDSKATVKVNGVAVASGVASDSIPLVVGTNPINVLVTAQDGTTQSTYTVTVTRLSTVSTLAGLAISTGTLSPAFATGTSDYLAIMPATTTGVAVTPTVTDPTATIKVNGTTVASGATSATIPITDTQAIATVVTAQDGSTTTYTLTVAFIGYEAWKTRVFTDPADLNDPAISGELETPAHDGITNLMKYALALDPMTCGTDGLPTVAQQDGYLALTYRKNKTATDVTYTVQAADDLTGNSWGPATIVLSQTDEGDHWLVTIRDNVPYAGQSQRFMRLQLSK
ncbi:MAG: cadherin-like beta sandwich domain-containing protein [Verrucomicrobiota bacterium]